MTEPIAVDAPLKSVHRPVTVSHSAVPKPAEKLEPAKAGSRPAAHPAAPPPLPSGGPSLLGRIRAKLTRKNAAIGASAVFSLAAGIAGVRLMLPGDDSEPRQTANVTQPLPENKPAPKPTIIVEPPKAPAKPPAFATIPAPDLSFPVTPAAPGPLPPTRPGVYLEPATPVSGTGTGLPPLPAIPLPPALPALPASPAPAALAGPPRDSGGFTAARPLPRDSAPSALPEPDLFGAPVAPVRPTTSPITRIGGTEPQIPALPATPPAGATSPMVPALPAIPGTTPVTPPAAPPPTVTPPTATPPAATPPAATPPPSGGGLLPMLPDARAPDPKLLDPKLPDPKLLDPKLPDPKLLDPKLPDPKLLDPKGPIQGSPVGGSGGPPTPPVLPSPGAMTTLPLIPAGPHAGGVPTVQPDLGALPPAKPPMDLNPGAGTKIEFTKPAGSPAIVPIASTERTPKTSHDEDIYFPKAGDKWEDISREFYNDPRYANGLRAYNKNTPLQGAGSVNVPPIHIVKKYMQGAAPAASGGSLPAPGTGATTPPDWGAAATPARTNNEKTFRVPQGGMSIPAIARITLGTDQRWDDISRLNPHLKTDELLPPGTDVKLPPDARNPG